MLRAQVLKTLSQGQDLTGCRQMYGQELAPSARTGASLGSVRVSAQAHCGRSGKDQHWKGFPESLELARLEGEGHTRQREQ